MIHYGQEFANSFDKDEFTFSTDAVLCKQSNSSVNKGCILLENQFTVEVF